MLGCLPASVYCERYNDTLDAINKRIQRGFWKQGEQYHIVEGSKERWIDLDGVNKWVRKEQK